MAFTSTDLSNVESAIINLATGQKAVQVSIGDKYLRYTETQLSDLRALRSTIQRELGLIQNRAVAHNVRRF